MQNKNDMKLVIAEFRFAVLMISIAMKKETIIALFNNRADAEGFEKFCKIEYPDLKFRVEEFAE